MLVAVLETEAVNVDDALDDAEVKSVLVSEDETDDEPLVEPELSSIIAQLSTVSGPSERSPRGPAASIPQGHGALDVHRLG